MLEGNIGAKNPIYLGKLSIAEDLESRISGNSELLASLLLDGAVNLKE